MPKKLMVSNAAALRDKYLGSTPMIQSALTAIVAADKKMNIDTIIVYIDDVAAMNAINVTPVTDKSSGQQNKVAIDGIFQHFLPDFMLILGAPDVIPHQLLTNPLPGDRDPNVPSDLPYACSAGYSQSIASFLAPTRVISRLPDIQGIPSAGAADPSYFLRVLAYDVDRRQQSAAAYQAYFSVSCDAWKSSTRTSLQNIFGDSAELQLSPPSGPNWTPQQVAPLSHFVNCHGGSNSPKFVGQSGSAYPTAMDAALMERVVVPSTVLSAECCYGAQLYNPASPTTIHMGMANTYIGAGAKAYFGSTNIAYGPPSGNGQADLITQYFLRELLRGKSVGQSALNARTTFVANSDMTSPTSLKTLGQFIVLGDPVMTPVAPPPPILATGSPTDAHLLLERAQVLHAADAVTRHKPYAVAAPEVEPSAVVAEEIQRLLVERGVNSFRRSSYRVHWPNVARDYATSASPQTFVHALTFRSPATQGAPFPVYTTFEFGESESELVSVAEFVSK